MAILVIRKGMTFEGTGMIRTVQLYFGCVAMPQADAALSGCSRNTAVLVPVHVEFLILLH